MAKKRPTTQLLPKRRNFKADQPGRSAPIVATAWRVQLRLDDAADERLPEFLNRYQRSPFTPEPGANCTFGGVGEPLS